MEFAPVPALLGGVAIGTAVAVGALVAGRVTGISGHLTRVLSGRRPADAALLLGLAAGGYLAQPAFIPADALPLPLLRTAAAGALVGLGTAAANGCTSGHAVCGLARASRRSAAATLTFMAAAAATAAATGTSALLMRGTTLPAARGDARALACAAAALAAATLPAAWLARRAGVRRGGVAGVAQVTAGLAFAGGLAASGMAVPLKVSSFFNVGAPHWDASLAFVFPGALPIAAAALWLAGRGDGWCLAEETSFPPADAAVDGKLLAGAACFGVGWGLAGLCPGPAVVLAGASARLLATGGGSGLLVTMLTYFAAYGAAVNAMLNFPAKWQGAGVAVGAGARRGALARARARAQHS